MSGGGVGIQGRQRGGAVIPFAFVLGLAGIGLSGLGIAAEAVAAPPHAAVGGPYAANVGEPVAFDGTGSFDPDGGKLTYFWEFGDGDTDTGPTPSHTYATPGEYTVKLTVVDPDLETDDDSGTASINGPPEADAGGPYAGDVGEPIVFDGSDSIDGDDGPLTYSWDFGDGHVGMGEMPGHEYAADGSFTAILRVTDAGGLFDEDEATVTVSVNADPVAEANGPYAGNVDESISFSSEGSMDPDGDPLTYRWDFGDGSTSDEANPSHQYAEGGAFVATLRVTDPGGGFGEDTASVTVNRPPSADAGPDRTGNIGVPIAFNGSGSDPDDDALTYHWDFGDGETAKGAQVSHTYDATGPYTATLRVTDPGGLFDEDTAEVSIENRPPVADAGPDQTGSIGKPIEFNGSGSDPDGDPLTYHWDFGDGETATGANVSHTYLTAGSFIATLRVTDPDDLFDEDTAVVTIDNRPPSADAGPDRSGNAGESIAFNGSGSDPDGDPLTYRWDFGDGNTATGANVSHTYASGGNYTATLRVSDPEGLFDEDTAAVTVNRPPQADANGPYEGNVGAPISFSSAGSNDPEGETLTFRWAFGDGTTSTQANPTHSYATGGPFTATLRVTDPDGLFDEDTASVTVNRAPTANAGPDRTGNIGKPVTFNGSGSDPDGDPLTYRWDFGDGNTATGANVSHTYVVGGQFTATLRVTDPDGLFDEDTAGVSIENRPPVADAGPDRSGNVGQPITFNGSGSDPDGDPLTYRWDFGDGNTATGASVSHTYLTGGSFTATLRVTDLDGAFDEDTAQVTVNRPPTANAGPDRTGNIGKPVTFSGSATDPDGGPLIYRWDFGDGSTATGANVSHTYLVGGQFTATLRVTDAGGLFDEDTAAVSIENRPPVADAGPDRSGNVGQPITFNGSGSDPDGDPLTYRWDFGDGQTATGASVSHTYVTGGTFTATLRVSDLDGAFDEDTAAVEVNRPPLAEANGPYGGNPGTPISFSSAGSTDPDGDTLVYRWSFGDGTTSTAANPTHTYLTAGPFTATLRVTDPDGVFDEDTAAVNVNRTPTADAGPDKTGAIGVPIAFNGLGSDPDGDALVYRWEFGDGQTATGANVSHTYLAGGVFTATLRVTDTGGLFDEDSAQVMLNRPPIAEAGPPSGGTYTGDRGATISFSSAGSGDPEGDPITYLWNFGDGGTSTAANPTHVYAVGGLYTATLTVTDDENLSDQDTAPVSINDIIVRAPVAGTVRSEGDTLTIHWSAFGTITTVAIEFRARASDPWTLVTNASAGVGLYTWRLPDIGNADVSGAVFRVQRVTGAPLFDLSDPFTVVNRGITVTEPTAGERIFELGSRTIEWTTVGYVPLVHLYYRLSPANSWIEIQRDVVSPAGGGSYAWTLPEVTEDKDQAQVRVRDARDPAATTSLSPEFTIANRTLTVTAPTPGTIWSEASSQLIQWQADGPIGEVAIEWRRQSQDPWSLIANRPASAMSHVWNVPAVTGDEDNVQIRLRETAALDDPVLAGSGDFTIQNRAVQVTAPAAGDTVSEREPALITWTTTGHIDTVRIEFRRRPGDPWETVVGRTVDDGEFLWPNTPEVTADEPEAAVRVTDVAAGADLAQGQSTPFLFVNRAVAPLLPAAGAIDCEADTVLIVWEWQGNVPAVDIHWRLAPSGPWTPALTGVPNVGSAVWNSPDLPTTSDIQLRIRQSGDAGVEAIWPAFTLRDRFLDLLRPQGGETFSEGDGRPITWNSDCLDSVRVEARRRPSDPWEIQGRGVYIDEGQIIWTVIRVDQQENEVQVRVTDASDPGQVFAISPPFTVLNRVLDVVRPTVTDSLSETTVAQVAWDWVGNLQRVSIAYRLEPADPWTPIIGNLANTGTYDWTVPAVDQDHRTAQLRVSDTNNPAIVDESDPFIVLNRALAVLYPDASAVLTESVPDTIRWHTSGAVPEVTVSFREEPAAPWQLVVAGVANTGSLEWVVPQVNRTLTGAQVRIEHATLPEIVAESAPFQILDRSFAVIEPAGGERWSEATSHLLRWTSFGDIDSVSIELVPLTGDPIPITPSTANDGEEMWLVPDLDSTLVGAQIRVADVRPPLTSALSAPFTVENRAIGLFSPPPVPRVQWRIGTRQEIQWVTTGAIDSVTIELGRDGPGGPFEEIAHGLQNGPGGGSIPWVVTGPETFHAVIRVRDARSPEVVGVTAHPLGLYDLVAPELCADFDHSNGVSVDELLLVEGIVVGTVPANEADSLAADGTRDGRVDVRDLLCGADAMLETERAGRGRPFVDAGLAEAEARGVVIRLVAPMGETGGGAESPMVPLAIEAQVLVAGLLIEAEVRGGAVEPILGPDGAGFLLDWVEGAPVAGGGRRVVAILRRERNDGEAKGGAFAAGSRVPLAFRMVAEGDGEAGGRAGFVLTVRRAEAVAADFQFLPVHLADVEASVVPVRVALAPNRPNPFNPSTVIPFDLPAAGHVRLELYDVQGRLVRRLADGAFEAGFHRAVWDGRDDHGRPAASGVYLCALRAGGELVTRKMTLLR